MNICINKTKEKSVKLIPGNLYKRPEDSSIYLCSYNTVLCNIKNGSFWYSKGGFGGYQDFQDVTDKYCLSEI